MFLTLTSVRYILTEFTFTYMTVLNKDIYMELTKGCKPFFINQLVETRINLLLETHEAEISYSD